ncbi:MAG TPA: hypothetical protein VH599_21775 [Ktedonobacterales bacterium]|jgi:hypothetical protein
MQHQQEQPDDLRTLATNLAYLDWRHGLTRNDIKSAYPGFPQSLYLRLPDSKRFSSPKDVLQSARLAASRAEGDFLGAAPDIPASLSVEEGGPPDWGASPLVTPGGAIDSGSAEDREEPGV